LTYQVALAMARGEYAVREVSMAKNFAAETAVSVTYDAVQIHGGMGYMRESLVERLSRDARLLPIGGGTQEIMKEIIAREMGI
jgi:acyl-CoA dehydrogenase